MRQEYFEILKNKALTDMVYRIILRGNTEGILPGQFVNVALDHLFLRRPLSVCDVEEDRLTLIYKTAGKGTEALSTLHEGKLDILCPLGNGYDLNVEAERILLLGGGVGIPPLYFLARQLKNKGKKVSVILGFNTEKEIFYEEEFRNLGCDVTVSTADGSYGVRGFVTDALSEDYGYFYACGPLPMLKAVYHQCKTAGEFSLEERMGCGFGACMGCSIQTKEGSKRVCKEGPVFKKEELLWQK